MPTYIGENEIIDRYLGDKNLEAAYIGDKKVYDPYTEITGYLPMIFKSRAAVALKNYRIYGTADGAGVEDDIVPHGYKLPLTVKGEKTENLAPPLSEWGNGYVSSSGPIAAATEAGKERYSPVISVEPNATYQWAYEAGQFPTGMYGAWFGFGWYDRDGNFISRTDGNAEVVSAVVAPANAKYVILSFDTYGEGYNTVFIKSSTHPDHYIPHRYTSDIPIYIGGSKLGEEEYVDFGEQKIYKSKSNLVTDVISNSFVNPSGVISTSNTINLAITPIEKDKIYTILYARSTTFMSCGFFEQYPTHGSVAYDNKRFVFASDYYTFTAPIDGYLASSVEPAFTAICFAGEAPYLQPIDPPVPLPPIPTYKGENTLSSTETLGEVTVKGRLSPSQWPLTNLIFHRYDEFYPELEGANRIAVSETFHLDAGAYILHQEVITSPEPVVVIQTEGFTGGIFPSFDGYWHVDTPGLYRFQVNKSNVLDPWNAAELETLSRTSTINKV